MSKPGMHVLLGVSLMLLLGGCDSSAGEVQRTPTTPAATSQPASPTPTALADIQHGSDLLPGPPPTYDAAPRPDTHTTSAAKLLGTGVVNWPVAAGPYLFWVEKRGSDQAIYGYDVAAQAQFIITSALRPDAGYGLLTDGQTLLWAESIITDENANPLYNIYGYDLTAHRPISLTVAPGARTNAYNLAFDNGTLFYADNTPSHYGLYAQDIFSGQERLISRCGGGPMAAEGTLAWGEPVDGCSGQAYSNSSGNSSCCLAPIKTALHLLKLDGSKEDTVLTSSYGNIRYAVSGDRIVWSIYSVEQPVDDEGVYLYDIGSGNRQRILSQAGYDPLVDGNKVVWNNQPTEQSPAWTVTSYDIGTSVTSLAVKESVNWTEGRAIAAPNKLVYTMTPLSGESKAYLISL
ncbi:MAG: hypothetical protein DLM69_04145, partial [Candidatus Chloroheliales bacterium]